MTIEQLRRLVRDVADFPKPGIVFKDLTPLLRDPAALHAAIEALVEPYEPDHIDLVVAPESRGFIFGAAVAERLQAGFAPVRKPGKLPWKTRRAEYALEYGTDSLEMHLDAVDSGERVLIVDDVLATGGTAAAVARMVEEAGGQVDGIATVIELTFLEGRERLSPIPVHSLLRY